jgi:hypothetical protein
LDERSSVLEMILRGEQAYSPARVPARVPGWEGGVERFAPKCSGVEAAADSRVASVVAMLQDVMVARQELVLALDAVMERLEVGDEDAHHLRDELHLLLHEVTVRQEELLWRLDMLVAKLAGHC